jgi:hypothetical protein
VVGCVERIRVWNSVRKITKRPVGWKWSSYRRPPIRSFLLCNFIPSSNRVPRDHHHRFWDSFKPPRVCWSVGRHRHPVDRHRQPWCPVPMMPVMHRQPKRPKWAPALLQQRQRRLVVILPRSPKPKISKRTSAHLSPRPRSPTPACRTTLILKPE